MRGDVARLDRCRGAGGSGTRGADSAVPRVRPFQYVTQRDIVFYAHFCKLDFFAVECPYACVAFRSYPRHLIKELEAVRPTAVLDIVRSGEAFLVAAGASSDAAADAADDAQVREVRPHDQPDALPGVCAARQAWHGTATIHPKRLTKCVCVSEVCVPINVR